MAKLIVQNMDVGPQALLPATGRPVWAQPPV